MPPERPASSLLLGFVRTRDQIDALTRALLPSHRPMFGEITLPLPNLDGAPELAFIRLGSWLYVHLFEAGSVSVKFLLKRDSTGQRGEAQGYLDLIHALRTWAQHNIDFSSPRDARIVATCQAWFDMRCGTQVPRSDDHWSALLSSLASESEAFLALLLELLGEIERDGDRDVICQQWEQRLDRDLPAHRYHALIAEVAEAMGRAAIDPVPFFQRHAHAFRDELRLLSEEFDFEVEARKLIERVLLVETAPVLPITGADIIEAFQISPGPEVGELLALGRQIYTDTPVDREQLLDLIDKRRTRDSQ